MSSCEEQKKHRYRKINMKYMKRMNQIANGMFHLFKGSREGISKSLKKQNLNCTLKNDQDLR